MNKVELSSIMVDIEKIIEEINRTANQIKTFGKRLSRGSFEYEKLELLYENICEVLRFWTGYTFIGHKKVNPLKQAFQRFFENLMEFICICQGVNIDFFNEFANKALFQGTLYRYLGHISYTNNDIIIDPIYDEIYVSWSKNPNNIEVKRKLKGTKTLIICEVSGDYYGIDLSVFGVVKSDEAEVVFPTIESTIIKEEIIKRD